MTLCSICHKKFNDNEIYEYRGAYACEDHIDAMEANRDHERKEIIAAEDTKTKVFKGLDLGDSIIGKANRKLLAGRIEVASTESHRLKQYERPDS